MLPLPPPPRHLRPRWIPSRTLALWLVLVVTFVVFYNLVAARPDDDQAQPEGSVVVPLVMLVAFVGFVAFYFVTSRRWLRVYNQGVAHFTSGDVARARPLFEQALKLATNNAQRGLSAYNLGASQVNLGLPEEALLSLSAAEATWSLRLYAPIVRRMTANPIALCYAQLGDVASARAWLAEDARRRGNEPPIAGVLPELLVLCRERHFAAAARTAADRFREVEALGGRAAHRARLLHAYALDALDAQAHAAEVAELLAALRPVRPGDFEPYTGRFPELAAFVERRGLVPAAPARPAA